MGILSLVIQDGKKGTEGSDRGDDVALEGVPLMLKPLDWEEERDSEGGGEKE